MLLETIVRSKGSTSLKEINSELSNFGDCVTMFRISHRCPSGTSTPKFWKSCSRQYFIVTLVENPHLRKAEPYVNRSGSISSKKSSISILSAIFGKTCSNTLQTSNVWLPNMSCLHPIRTCFSVTCPRLDENDGSSYCEGLHVYV